QKIRTLEEGGIFWINRLYELPEPLPENLIKLLWKVRERILYQPLNYLHNVNGEIIRFFGIMNENLPFKVSYDEHRVQAIKQKNPTPRTWTEILQFDKTSLVIDDLTYQELARYRFWTRDVILKAWFNYCLEGERRKNNSTNIEILLYKLIGYIYISDSSRDPLLISHYRELYEEIGALKSIYSGNFFESKTEYHIDHLLPWSYYPINRFWNLFPSEPSINITKSNNIPEWTDFLEQHVRSHIQLCLVHKEHPLILNDLKYLYHNILKNRELDVINRENDLIEEEVISFLKSERKKLLEIIPGRIFNPE
ncbi:MAG: HNH endonuclease domain-containing protein, partial [Candidatus Thorarchaeota archaeon]